MLPPLHGTSRFRSHFTWHLGPPMLSGIFPHISHGIWALPLSIRISDCLWSHGIRTLPCFLAFLFAFPIVSGPSHAIWNFPSHISWYLGPPAFHSHFRFRARGGLAGGGLSPSRSPH